MVALLRWVFFALLDRPLLAIVLGLNVRGREQLPMTGPGIMVANHNSHLDAMVMMSLLPHRLLHRVRPVAAQDYFLRGRLLAWFSTRIVGILPIARKGSGGDRDPLAGCYEALERGQILVLFPEGTRGEPEVMAPFRGGVAKLAQRFPDVPIIPIHMRGLGKALPRGEALLVPFMLEVHIDPALRGREVYGDFLGVLRQRIEDLDSQHPGAEWD
jgi:1-acyl-sn-glycerol-3-phosphate acyltransferase